MSTLWSDPLVSWPHFGSDGDTWGNKVTAMKNVGRLGVGWAYLYSGLELGFVAHALDRI